MHLLEDTPLRRVALAAGLLAVAGSTPWWGGRVLSTLAFFRVRAVEVEGAHYVSPGEVVDRLHLDTLSSVWSDLTPLEARVRRMAGIRDVTVGRKLPSTVVIRIVERTPIALAPAAGGLRPYDGNATALPIDPTAEDLDLPIVAQPDPLTLHLLASLRDAVPTFYGQISQVRRSPAGDLIFQLPGLRVLARPGAEARRFAAVPAVTADLARRRVRAQELDLRFRDQVVARLQ